MSSEGYTYVWLFSIKWFGMSCELKIVWHWIVIPLKVYANNVMMERMNGSKFDTLIPKNILQISLCFFLHKYCILPSSELEKWQNLQNDRSLFWIITAIKVFNYIFLYIYIKFLWQGDFDTTLCDKVCQWFAEGQQFLRVFLLSPSTKLAVTI